MVALLTSVRNSPCFGGLRRTKTCHWQLFARPSMLFGYFLHDAKSDKPFPLRESFEVLQTSKQCTKIQFRTNKIKSFAAFETFLSESFAPFGAARPACFSAAFGGILSAAKPPQIKTAADSDSRSAALPHKGANRSQAAISAARIHRPPAKTR